MHRRGRATRRHLLLGGVAAAWSDTNADAAPIAHRRHQRRLCCDHGRVTVTGHYALHGDRRQRLDIAVVAQAGEVLQQLAGDGNLAECAIVAHANDEGSRPTMVRQVVGKGTDSLRELDRVGYGDGKRRVVGFEVRDERPQLWFGHRFPMLAVTIAQ